MLRAVQRRELRLRLRARDAAPQAAEDADALVAVWPKLLAVRRNQPPHVGGLGIEREARGHHANHRACAIIERDAAPDDVAARGKRVPPETIRQNDRAPARQIVGLEGAPDRSRNAEHAEDLDARRNREHDLRVACIGQDLIAGRPRRGAELLEADAVPPPRVEVLEGREDLGETGVLDVAVPHGDEPIDVAIRQRLDHYRRDDAEDRGGRADAERERGHGDRGDARRAPPAAEREAEVACAVAQPRQPVGVARPLLRGREVAEPHARRAPRLLDAHPAADVLVGQRFEVEARLLVERRVGRRRTQRGAQAPNPAHGGLPLEDVSLDVCGTVGDARARGQARSMHTPVVDRTEAGRRRALSWRAPCASERAPPAARSRAGGQGSAFPRVRGRP